MGTDYQNFDYTDTFFQWGGGVIVKNKPFDQLVSHKKKIKISTGLGEKDCVFMPLGKTRTQEDKISKLKSSDYLKKEKFTIQFIYKTLEEFKNYFKNYELLQLARGICDKDSFLT